jgi:hypothetical protein
MIGYGPVCADEPLPDHPDPHGIPLTLVKDVLRSESLERWLP